MVIALELGWMDVDGRFQPLDAPGTDLGAGMMRFVVDGAAIVLDWNLGPVAVLLRQLDAAVVRLRAGQPALVRSAVDHHQGVPCFLFAPVDGASRIRVSELQVARVSSAAGLGAAYPVDDPQAEELYAHVLAHRETLLEAHLLEGQSDDVIDGLVLGLLGAIGHVPGWDATRLMARLEERRTRSV